MIEKHEIYAGKGGGQLKGRGNVSEIQSRQRRAPKRLDRVIARP